MSHCPKCQKLEYTNVSASLRVDRTDDGEVKEVLTRNYHCVSCGTFVRGEDIKPAAEIK